MKYGFTLFLTLATTIAVWAQPTNDDCDSAIDLGMAPNCSPQVIYNNVDATASDIGQFNIPDCYEGGNVDRDVWFTFQASDTILDYTLTITGVEDGDTPAMSNPQVVIYRGQCIEDGLAELQFCASAEDGVNEVSLNFSQLTLGVTYFIRINDWSPSGDDNAGAFNICLEQTPPINTIDGDGSNACTGFIYDTGGPEGNYGDNEDFTYTICPSQPHACIDFTLNFYNIEGADFGVADLLQIYDGDDPATGVLLADISQQNFGGGTDAGGSVCFSTQASSGCLTLVFQSDFAGNLEGFEGFWQCSTTPCEPPAPVMVESGVDEDAIVAALTGPQTQVTNVELNCDENAYGVFTGDNSNLGLDRGVLLTTGSTEVAIGPNTDTGEGVILEPGQFDPNTPDLGDPDLNAITALGGDDPLTQPSLDACILEFDVFVNTEELIFEYIFGSEEYTEFVDDIYNDIFAFLVSGDGIPGEPTLNNQLNIAVLPNGDVAEINSINHLTNWEYYRDNVGQLNSGVEYDGLTSSFMGEQKSLIARASVAPCKTYHLKLAISDRGDESFDSGVFISDLRGGSPQIFVDFVNGIDYFVEDCTTEADSIVFSWNNTSDEDQEFVIEVGGTATPDADYILNLPPSLVFPPGESTFTFPISILSDPLAEGEETILINLSANFGCGDVEAASFTAFIRDEIQLEILGNLDTFTVCDGIEFPIEATGTDTYFWQPPGIFTDPFAAATTVLPTQSQEISVIGTVGICQDTAFAFVELVSPELEILQEDTVSACTGDSIVFTQMNNLTDPLFNWEPAFAIDGSNTLDSAIVTPTFSFEVSVEASIGACSVRDSVFINFNSVVPVTVIEDTTICQGSTLVLAEAGFNNGQTFFQWEPADAFEDPTDPESPAFIDSTTTFILTRNSENGQCNDTFEIMVESIPAALEITNPDTVSICLGDDPVVLNAVTDPPGGQISWFPEAGGISPPDGPTYTVDPQVTLQYFATYETEGCRRTDSVWVTVDSLPDLTLEADPFEDPYCPGDTFFITSPIYDAFDFPRITHTWSGAPGLQTPDSLLNAYVIAADSSLFTRINTNGACRDTSTIQINVIRPPTVEVGPDTTVCAGDMVQLNFELIEPQYEGTIEWMPETGLTCTDCPNPVATVQAATPYQVSFTTDEGECPFNFSLNLDVLPPPQPVLVQDPVICLGDDIVLLLSLPEDSTTYRITGGGVDTNDPLTVLSPTETTTYTFTATNSCGTFTEDVTVIVLISAEVDISGPAEVCAGELVSLIANSNTDPANTPETFTWSVDGSTVSTTANYDFTALNTVTVTLIYATPCFQDTLDFMVTVSPPPSLQTPGNISVCAGTTVTLNSQTSPQTSYSWSDGSGIFSTDPAPMVTPTSTTTYSVTATSPNCPVVEETFTITVIETYTVDAGEDQSFCPGESITLSASTTPADVPGTYVWTLPGGGTESGQAITVSEGGDYTVSFTDDANCFTETDIVTVSQVNLTPLDIIATDNDGNLIDLSEPIGAGSTITLMASDAPIGFSYTYSWESTMGEPMTAEGQTISVVAPPSANPNVDEYTLTYTVTATSTPSGCVQTAVFSVQVVTARSEFPDIISPNGDGRNDLFKLFYNGEVSDYNVTVFNRWGQEVWSTTDPDEGWDGIKDGEPQPMDAYLYIATFRQNGMDQQYDGQFSLIR